MTKLSPGMRDPTLLEKQPYFFAYGFGISLFSPLASLYQLVRLNPKSAISKPAMARMSARILPHQTLLKVAQMNASTPVKEQLNPWAAFALVGVLQGGVYGQANIFFAKELKIGGELSYRGMFRGVGFAGGRDMISQGVPYVMSTSVRRYMIDPMYPTDDNPTGVAASVKQWIAVIGTSVFATFASQGLHNCQITMQANQKLTYLTAVQKAYSENGIHLLYRGGEARVMLLLIVNILNEALLKKAWEPRPI